MQVPTVESPPAIHYSIPERVFEHKISTTAAKVVRISPGLVFGESNLFNYDDSKSLIVLSSPFKKLLKLLVNLNQLDPRALEVKSLFELNSILQKHQGIEGGLMRKTGTERWHLEDNPELVKHQETFKRLLGQLGFVLPKSIDSQISVDHCIIFGARTKSMEKRIIQALGYLEKNLYIEGHVFLLGSNRKLVADEISHLEAKIEKLQTPQRDYWKEVFNDPELSTEANAFMFLWECTAPQTIQDRLKEKLIGINSTRIGNSYREKGGHRVTTEVTIEDWMSYYKPDEPQAICTIAEQPYIRLGDQLRFSVLSRGKKASLEELIDRIKNTTFHLASPAPDSPPLISITLDEIGRNVYGLTQTLKYLEGIHSNS